MMIVDSSLANVPAIPARKTGKLRGNALSGSKVLSDYMLVNYGPGARGKVVARYGQIRRADSTGDTSCLECGRRLKLLPRHLLTQHAITTAEYRAKHGPDAPLGDPISDAHKRRMSATYAAKRQSESHVCDVCGASFTRRKKKAAGRTCGRDECARVMGKRTKEAKRMGEENRCVVCRSPVIRLKGRAPNTTCGRHKCRSVVTTKEYKQSLPKKPCVKCGRPISNKRLCGRCGSQTKSESVVNR